MTSLTPAPVLAVPPRLITLDPAGDLVEVIAGTLAGARHLAGLSQRQLAANAGVGHSMIAAYEAGRRHPTVTTLARILAAAHTDAALSLAHRAGPAGRPWSGGRRSARAATRSPLTC